MSGARAPEPEYVAARRVLLDAFDALGSHRQAVVLVGAQAIYLHVGEGDMAVPPYTTDGDLAIDPGELADAPNLPGALEDAGFELAIRPGTWSRTEVQIDFLVPESLGGSGRRGARLGVHGRDFARKASGLEAAIIDHTLVRVGALEDVDKREFDVRVAGTAALLIAKLHKVAERAHVPERTQNKDGLDILRLLRFAETSQLAATLTNLKATPLAADATRHARSYLEEHFCDRGGAGTQLAVLASAGLEDPDAIAISCEVLAQRLLNAWK